MVNLKINENGFYIEDDSSNIRIKLTIDDLMNLNSQTTKATEQILEYILKHQ